ncbi:Glucosamine-phosphate N-acetyltransferase-like protein [Orbilia ellipsospora]|uniref:Glucosamine 6-phosphate N-acetyltransferase n=1 Tax=Orbilia ellipsospora TaxID=2528407 RepID=A0AAV9X1E5_9PEZI
MSTISLPSELTSALPSGYGIRRLQKTDKADFLAVLSVLTTVGDIPDPAWNDRFEYIAKNEDTYTILCITDEAGQVCATGSLIVERKFIRNCGLVGHIEDIAVAKDKQGKRLGLRMIQALDHIAEQAGCYKSILDCSESNKGFYEKCGFKFAGVEMAHYYSK